MSNLVPMVIKRSSDGERSMDIFSRLLEGRIILLTGQVTDAMAEVVQAQLLHLYQENPEKTIHVYINSPGGSVTAGMVMYNTMKLVNCDVATYVTGIAASMGSFLAACGGTKGKRFMLPETEHMIHQPLGGFQGQSSDIEIHANHIVRTRANLERIYAECTGKTVEEIHAACDRDNYMSAQESLDFGLCDKIITKADMAAK